jgi:hypothetical protein
MRQRRNDSDGSKRGRLSAYRHRRVALGLVAAAASLAFAAPAMATPQTPPFTQCPALGFDTSCEVLIVINHQGGIESFVDPSQENYEGANDYLVGVKNDSSSSVPSITLRGSDDIFGFLDDGLCSGINETDRTEGFLPPPEGCPFGPTGWEGPDTSFSNYKEVDPELDADEGTVNFTGGLAPSGTAYFSLHGLPEVLCVETACEPTTVSGSLSGGSQSGATITVPSGTPVTDSATLSGSNAEIAGGGVNYAVYSDPGCTRLVEEPGEVTVAGPSVAASNPEALPPGTYYWQASYTGDAHNGSAETACGSEVETVTGPPTCTKAAGAGIVGTGGTRQNLHDKLNTSLTGKQKLTFTWNHGEHSVHLTHLSSASCAVHGGELTFTGRGAAAERKVKGYEMSFSITTAGGHTYLSLTVEEGHAVVAKFVHEQLNPAANETIVS